MKNSAWYQQLWRKKLDEHSLKESAETSWAGMKDLLDKQMPANPSTIKKPGRFLGSTIISTLGFILPAAAMIAGLTFVAVKHNPFKPEQPAKTLHLYKIKTSTTAVKADSISIDSLSAGSSSKFSNQNIASASKTISEESKAGSAGIRPLPVAKESSKASANRTIFTASLFSGRAANGYHSKSPGKEKTKNVLEAHSLNTDKNTLSASGDSKTAQASNQQQASNSTIETMPNEVKPKLGTETLEKGKKPNDKDSKAAASSKIKPVKTAGAAKRNNSHNENSTYEIGIESGLNAGKGGANAIFGIWGSFALNPKWQIITGIRYDRNMTLQGDITHKSFAPVDSLNSFKVTNSRKISSITVPVTIGYKLSDKVILTGGPLIRFSANQSKITNKLGTVTNIRDTISKSHSIDSLLQFNSINKVTVGIAAGVSIHLNRFYIDGRLQQNITPYKINTGLGNFQQNYRSLQIGIRYTIKRK